MALKPCLGCGQLIPSGSRCRACALPRTRSGSTRAWRRMRELVLARDLHRCRYCGAPASHVDHIVPVVKGGRTIPENLAAACRRCNLYKAAK